MKPAVSIIVPLYNKERHIALTLKSALSQTFRDFEIIVIDDGSTDAGLEKVKEIQDSRLRYIETDNHGVSAARNFAISQANADLIAFLDADDLWQKDHLLHLTQLHQDFPDAGLYATSYFLDFGNGEISEADFPELRDFPGRGFLPDFFHASMHHRIAWTSAVMVPKHVLNEIGNFDEKITLGAGEDLDLWVRIAVKYKVAFDTRASAVHNLAADNRMSLTKTKHREFARLDRFLSEEKHNPSLKKFLDLYRAEFALKMKIAGDRRSAFYLKNTDKKNLSGKTRSLLRLPGFALRGLYRLKKILERYRIRPSAYH